jgi:uncharacterized phage-associated protein
MSFSFDESKALSVVLFILKNLGGRIDKHKLFKILYFADQKHLTRYGRPVIGDDYIAMSNGPVPSTLYDAVKSINNDRYSFNLFKQYFSTEKYFIISNTDPDMDELSESDIECLLESIKENAKLPFDSLTKKSHGPAWQNAGRDAQIPIIWIAKEGNASKEMIQYLKENIDDFQFCRAPLL